MGEFGVHSQGSQSTMSASLPSSEVIGRLPISNRLGVAMHIGGFQEIWLGVASFGVEFCFTLAKMTPMRSPRKSTVNKADQQARADI